LCGDVGCFAIGRPERRQGRYNDNQDRRNGRADELTTGYRPNFCSSEPERDTVLFEILDVFHFRPSSSTHQRVQLTQTGTSPRLCWRKTKE
jgi:hypothetical protein